MLMGRRRRMGVCFLRPSYVSQVVGQLLNSMPYYAVCSFTTAPRDRAGITSSGSKLSKALFHPFPPVQPHLTSHRLSMQPLNSKRKTRQRVLVLAIRTCRSAEFDHLRSLTSRICLNGRYTPSLHFTVSRARLSFPTLTCDRCKMCVWTIDESLY